MNEKTRLQNCETALKAKGVRDVKFFLGKTSEKPVSEVASAVATVLEAVQTSKHTPMKPIGDHKEMKARA
jgi:hypothetical protein